ncbi:LOW QUALITY PROTEIN: schlafen-like protein 1 [Amphiura filiformis]|uniref:LOW QUALITY PROTEIN: schlafen-like protein 1 n=1 Tax=Amphiura filiformis TaxID=82378 RepID=UPI003B2267AC
MASALKEQHAVFLGNLDDSVPKEDVAAMIKRLILQASGLTVELAAIRVKHSRPSRCLTAFVNFSSQVDQRRTLQTLSNIPVIPQGLVKPGRKLKVDIYKPKFSQPQQVNFTNGDSFFKGQQLGNETRILEFKRGGGDLRKQLKKHLAKYTCAFLNSQGGTLMIGVDDTGFVQGVHCDRAQEDQTRINIDDIIHQFDPPVLPQMYQVQFTPVRDESGIEADLNLKVIEIQVNHSRPDTLYETPSGEVYIRRDGSIRGPLRPKDIQEWCRLKFSNNSDSEDTALKNQVDNLQERLQKLESNRQELDSSNNNDVKRTNSTVCTIL